jgi:hypothetical protein
MRRGAGDAGSGGAESSRPGSVSTVGKTKLRSGARLSENEGEAAGSERREPKRKMYFPRRRDRRAGWTGRPGDFGLRGRRARWAFWARGQAGRGVGRAENQEKEISELEIGFLNLSRLWNFDMRIFPKFF